MPINFKDIVKSVIIGFIKFTEYLHIPITLFILTLWAIPVFLYKFMNSSLAPGPMGYGTLVSKFVFDIGAIPTTLIILLMIPFISFFNPLGSESKFLMGAIIVFEIGIAIALFRYFFKKGWLHKKTTRLFLSRNIILASICWGSFQIMSHFKYGQLESQPDVWSPLYFAIKVLGLIPGYFPINKEQNYLLKDIILTFSTIALIYIALVAVKALLDKLRNIILKSIHSNNEIASTQSD